MRTRASHLIVATALLAGLGLSLAACDEAEQGRILRYQKGTYLGQKDTTLPTETASALRDRTAMQSGI
jgi:hypothetical protein